MKKLIALIAVVLTFCIGMPSALADRTEDSFQPSHFDGSGSYSDPYHYYLHVIPSGTRDEVVDVFCDSHTSRTLAYGYTTTLKICLHERHITSENGHGVVVTNYYEQMSWSVATSSKTGTTPHATGSLEYLDILWSGHDGNDYYANEYSCSGINNCPFSYTSSWQEAGPPSFDYTGGGLQCDWRAWGRVGSASWSVQDGSGTDDEASATPFTNSVSSGCYGG